MVAQQVTSLAVPEVAGIAIKGRLFLFKLIFPSKNPLGDWQVLNEKAWLCYQN